VQPNYYKENDMPNNVEITGNLTRDPELRYTANGKGVLNFTIASNHKYKVKDEERVETWFANVVCWNDADKWQAALKKGSYLMVKGRMLKEKYVDKEGTEKSTDKLMASAMWLPLPKDAPAAKAADADFAPEDDIL
jgi:single-strand DNA-binding protein